MPDVFREAWTERIRYLLTHDDQTMDLTGYTVDLVGVDGTGASVNFTAKVGIVDAEAGIVYYDPDAADLTLARSPYRLRWKTTTGGRSAFFPRAGPLVWNIEKP